MVVVVVVVHVTDLCASTMSMSRRSSACLRFCDENWSTRCTTGTRLTHISMASTSILDCCPAPCESATRRVFGGLLFFAGHLCVCKPVPADEGMRHLSDFASPD